MAFALVHLNASLPYMFWKLRSVQGVGFALIALVVYYAVVTGIERWRKHRTKNWPTAVGAITDVTTEFVSQPNAVDYWRVHFVYHYIVDGKDYSGKYKVNAVNEDLGKEAAEGLAAGQATVHFDPNNPAKSVLWEDEVWKLY